MTDVKPVVLAIEDDLAIRRFLEASLTTQGFKLVTATSAREGLSLAASHRPAVVLLDLGLPDQDGLEVIKQLRGWSPVPIVVISARGKESDKIKALDGGADDYLTKPFGMGELLARIRVCLRHAERKDTQPPEPVFAVGDLQVDLSARQVLRAGNEVHLTPTEYRMLALLVKHAGKVVTQRQLLMEIWGEARQEQTEYLRIYMHQLRQKLEPNPIRPRYLITETGVGYRLRDEL